MEIRLLSPSDAESYWKLRLQALKQNPEAFLTSYEDSVKRVNPVEQTARSFTNQGNYTFGAFDGEELIGTVTVLQDNRAKTRHRADIFAMYVTPKKQGVGIGKALMEAAITKVKNIEEIEKINLTVTSSNEKAKRLYNKLGFKTFGLEEKAIKVDGVYFDEEYMVLHLNRQGN